MYAYLDTHTYTYAYTQFYDLTIHSPYLCKAITSKVENIFFHQNLDGFLLHCILHASISLPVFIDLFFLSEINGCTHVLSSNSYVACSLYTYVNRYVYLSLHISEGGFLQIVLPYTHCFEGNIFYVFKCLLK
uniref:Uncharacterized protein n=1 Tax=Octopus bimaculoides TaxID=37653 RepID=A0A0L8G4I5_OCTBM